MYKIKFESPLYSLLRATNVSTISNIESRKGKLKEKLIYLLPRFSGQKFERTSKNVYSSRQRSRQNQEWVRLQKPREENTARSSGAIDGDIYGFQEMVVGKWLTMFTIPSTHFHLNEQGSVKEWKKCRIVVCQRIEEELWECKQAIWVFL